MRSILFFLLTLLSFPVISATQTITFSDDFDGYIGKSLTYDFTGRDFYFTNYSDLKGELKGISYDVPNFQLKDSALWMDLRIHNNSEVSPFLIIDNSWLDYVILYEVKSDGSLSKIYDVSDESFSERVIPTAEIVFPLKLKTGETKHYVLRIECMEQFLLPISIKKESDFFTRKADVNLFSGFYFGLILVMIFYNIFIYFSTRDLNYLLYVISIAAIGLTQFTLSGYGFKYLWPNNPWWSENAVFIMGILSGIGTVIFSQYFLKIRRYYKTMFWIFNAYIGLYILSFIILLFQEHGLSYQIINFNAGSSFLLIITAYFIYRKGFKPAKFYLIALSLFLIGVMVYVARDYNYLPYNLWTTYSLEIGSALEVILLSLALADRINTLKKEREESRLKAIEALKENERIVREQNVMLEQRVKERTKDLEKANQELNRTLRELKEAQTQLVESEKMASLGQLTAGVAHEINNPINFVTSNINPLKMDINDLIDVLDRYDKLIEEQGDLKEKLEEIQKYKDEIDFKYSVDEISSLLTGIEEGAKRTANIVKGLKNFSRVDEEGYKNHDLEEGLDSTLIILNNALKNKIKIVRDYGEIPKVECRGDKINQVFMNILSNAIQAIEMKDEMGNDEKIIVKTSKEGSDQVRISIKDSGTGMSEDTKNKIFEPFFTTKPVGQGTGLGMSIVFGIIENHYGEIKVESKEGEGTEFIIILPVNHYKPNEH